MISATRVMMRVMQIGERYASSFNGVADRRDMDRPANQIKFNKMPLRTRAGSSPIPGSALRNHLMEASTLNTHGEGPSVMITSPSGHGQPQ